MVEPNFFDGEDGMKLNDKDAQIVDLLLDCPTPKPTASGAFVESADLEPKRVQTIQKVLSLLDGLPAEDPPADLVARTLDRVDVAIELGSRSRPPPGLRLVNDRQPPA
jgi:hypothetical protein